MGAAFAFTCIAPAHAQPALIATPALPGYGQAVSVTLAEAGWPLYLPATRFTRVGSVIEIEYEYVPDGFGPINPADATAPLPLGELAPGNYTLRGRMRNLAAPSTAPIELSAQLAVVPPPSWGIYLLPAAPQAYSATWAIVRSAAYFDPGSMSATVSGNTVRVEFDYRSDLSLPGPRMSTFGSVRIPGLAPGAWRIEGWGRASPEADHEVFFTREFSVASTTPVVEFYSALLGHYFMAAGIDEIDLLDRGQGDWKRTGQRFLAWMRQSDAPPGAAPACRFYASGPNSHFYTVSGDECEALRALELQQRAEALARGEPFLGWAYEATAFWAVVAQAGSCPGGTRPMYRAYNNRASQMDSNHRFMADATQRDAMSFGWRDEGVHFCTAA